MLKRKLGENGPEVSLLGYSMWFMLMKESWRIQDDIAMLKAIQAGIECGINWIDTAPLYGFGHAESLLARGISHIPREKLIISSKFGIDAQNQNRYCIALKPDEIRKSLENSLRRLETDYIDIYQPHLIPPDHHAEPIWEELEKLKDEGKIRWAGAANFDITQIRSCASIDAIQSIQLPYSLSFRDVQEELLPYCSQHNIGVIAYSPVLLYYLLVKLDIEKSRFKHNLIRSMFTHNEDPSTALNLNKRLLPLAEERNLSISQVTVAWICSFSEINSILITAKNVHQVEKFVEATENKLAKEDLAFIGELIAETVGV